MYSAAMSSPLEGVLRPSSASEAMNDKCPRKESDDTRSRTVRTSGVMVYCCGAACCALRQQTAIHSTRPQRIKRAGEKAAVPGFISEVIRHLLVVVSQTIGQTLDRISLSSRTG